MLPQSESNRIELTRLLAVVERDDLHRVDAPTGMREYDELGVVIRP